MATSMDKWERITVDDLKEEIGVPDDQLNRRCTKKHLSEIAKSVRNFNLFATKFGMSAAVLRGIETNQNLEFVQKVEAVFMWWHYNIRNATYRSFIQVCIELEEGGLAREMCQLCAEGMHIVIASTSSECSIDTAVESPVTQCSMEMPPIQSASVCDEETIPCSIDTSLPPLKLSLKACNITHKSVELKWFPPDTAVESYTVFYHKQKDPDNTLRRIIIDGQEDHIHINGLTHDTQYVFKLHAKLSTGVSLESDETDVLKTLFHLPVDMQSKSKLLSEKTKKHCTIYELTNQQTMINKIKKVAKYEVGQPIQNCPEKVLMLVGATGAGKTTLINAFANYMYGIQWDDDFRFILAANERKKSGAHCQDSWIKVYTLHRAPDSPVPYSLTIIDTPSFRDTEQDKKIVDQIKDFILLRPLKGADVLHGIGFVIQSSIAQLSPSQKFMYDSMLSIGGSLLADITFLMTTFADSQDPPVMDAIVEAKISHQEYFKFNNSALFVNGKESMFDAMFWNMGVTILKQFFSNFGKNKHRSIQLKVLSEWKQLENVLQQLQPQIYIGLSKMDELQRVIIMLERNKSLIEQNKDFVFRVPVTKQRKVDLPPGRYTTNCLNCNYTCHDNCTYSNNEDKKRCCAMNAEGNCLVCPGNCVWSKHMNNPCIFEIYEDEEVRTSDELKERYDTAKEGESRTETIINNIRHDVDTLTTILLDLINKAQKSLMRLDEIALKPNPLSEVDYIDVLIKSEEQQCKRGWKERVASYKVLRKRASLMQKIKEGHNSEDDVQESLFSWLGEDGASSSYTPQTLSYLKNPGEKKKKWYEYWK